MVLISSHDFETVPNFILRWNGFLWLFVVAHGENIPLTVGLASFQTSEEFAPWNTVTAAAMFLTGSSLLLFLVTQKYIIKGITIGAGKRCFLGQKRAGSWGKI